MMKSESEHTSLSVPTHLRSYGTRPDKEYREYVAYLDRAESNTQSQQTDTTQQLSVAKRLLGAVGILIIFVVGVDIGQSRWNGDAGEQHLVMKTNSKLSEAGPSEQKATLLGLQASNEYGEYNSKDLAMYGFPMLIEPFRETTISVVHDSASSPNNLETGSTFDWTIVEADQDGAPLEGAVPLVRGKGGAHETVLVTGAGKYYAVTVRQATLDGTLLAEGNTVAISKYVRRELRQLSDSDRTEFFETMRVFYTTAGDEGHQRYGWKYTDYGHVAAIHNSQNFCYHNGMQFLTAHAAFNLMVEQSLRLINPRVSLPIWDFMIESGTLGASWPNSEIFGKEMFGSAMGRLENGHQIQDGWFANITSLYDPGNIFSGEEISPNHNPFGYIDASYNYQDNPVVTRSHSFCGLKGEASFAKCSDFIGCFQMSRSLGDWSNCMESQIHANMHGWFGGGWDCKVDMEDFHTQNPRFSRGLLTFVLGYLLANQWPSNSLMADYNTCDTMCKAGETEQCGCTCLVDPFKMEADEVYNLTETALYVLGQRFYGDIYVDYDEAYTYPYGFVSDGVRLSEEDNLLLLRNMLAIGCEPGKVGAMSTGSSPLDPIFWVIHPIFEKGLHALLLSPTMSHEYDLGWVDGTCNGSKSHDNLPFSADFLGIGASPEPVTNADLIALLNPRNVELPYVYQDFRNWGTCDGWDPCDYETISPPS